MYQMCKDSALIQSMQDKENMHVSAPSPEWSEEAERLKGTLGEVERRLEERKKRAESCQKKVIRFHEQKIRAIQKVFHKSKLHTHESPLQNQDKVWSNINSSSQDYLRARSAPQGLHISGRRLPVCRNKCRSGGQAHTRSSRRFVGEVGVERQWVSV